MGLLDLFSGSSGRNAAIWGAGTTQGGADQQRAYQTDAANSSLSALGTGMNQGRSDLMGQYGQSYGSLGSGLNNATSSLGSGVTGAASNLNQTANILSGAGAQSDSYWQPLATQANAGYGQYGDATGVNGAAGQYRATQNFRTGPGYQFQLGQGVDAATRAASAAGMAASGNTMQAAQKYGSGLADQEWDDYIKSLSPYLDKATDIASARTGISQHTGDQLAANQTNIANLYNDYGKNLSSLYSGYGKDTSSLSTGYGNSLASLANTYGQNASNVYGGLGTALSNITGAETNTLTGLGTAGLTSGQTANQNSVNALMQLANLAAGNASKVTSAFA